MSEVGADQPGPGAVTSGAWLVGHRPGTTPPSSIVGWRGWAEREPRRPWSAETVSQVGSVSKLFVSAVALTLVARGELSLDEPVVRLLAGCDPSWAEVTVGQLLTNTAGVAHWDGRPGFDPAIERDPDERLRRIVAAPLEQPPGRSWSYSSPGFIVLAAVLGRCAGARYADLARELVVEPLRLSATSIGPAGTAATARGYRQGEPVAAWSLSTMPGTGDVCSTVGDIARFVAAMHTGELLAGPQQQVLHSVVVPLPLAGAQQTGRAVVTDGYGLGLFTGVVAGRRAYLHPGDNPGYQAIAAWLPDPDLTVVVLSNDEGDELESALAELVRAALDGHGMA